MVPEISDEDKAAVERLVAMGWDFTPPPDTAWTPAFKAMFYEPEDAPGEVYVRVDLPEGLYYALQDAARKGLESIQMRLHAFEKVERDVGDLERNTPPHKALVPRQIGVMDGVELSSMELRGMTRFLRDQASHWQKALDRADTRKHKA